MLEKVEPNQLDRQDAVPGDAPDEAKDQAKSGEAIPREAMEKARALKIQLRKAEVGDEVTIKTATEEGERSISGVITHDDNSGRLSLKMTEPADVMMGIDVEEGGAGHIQFGELANDGSAKGEQFISGLLTGVEIDKKKTDGAAQQV